MDFAYNMYNNKERLLKCYMKLYHVYTGLCTESEITSLVRYPSLAAQKLHF